MDHPKGFILTRDFYRRDTSLVARELLGKMLVRVSGSTVTSGIIIEAEAYYGIGDPASHAFRGETPRSRIMFGNAGFAYVYLCYGMYWLLNAVTEKEGKPGAVLIRGLKPFSGTEYMKKRRGKSMTAGLADGPGKLTISMDIDGKYNGCDLTEKAGGLYILRSPQIRQGFEVKKTSRIGVNAGKDRLLRYIAVGL